LIVALLALLLAPLLAAVPSVGAAEGERAMGRAGIATTPPGGEAVGLEPLGDL
jgi:hypothetical protein